VAFSKIGMDAGMKVFLKFSSKFFDQNIIGGAICAAYVDDCIGKAQNDNVLLAFIMGEQAEYLTTLGSDAAITTALLQELDVMYNGRATASFIASHVQNWTTNPFVKGAYSYSTVGMGDARNIATQAISKKLYFAGEAMNTNGHHQTVHGAIETGYREVINILKKKYKESRLLRNIYTKTLQKQVPEYLQQSLEYELKMLQIYKKVKKQARACKDKKAFYHYIKNFPFRNL
jgi:lysine-specific histone demethylase 1B